MTAPADARAEAVRLRSQEGLGCKRIARLLGVSPSTVRRWTNPEYAERQLRLSREAKRRRRGVCERCGGETRYSGGRNSSGTPVATLCARCGTQASVDHHQALRGSGDLQPRILAFLDEPRRLSELQRLLSAPQAGRVSTELGRMIRYGTVERVERGLYRRVQGDRQDSMNPSDSRNSR